MAVVSISETFFNKNFGEDYESLNGASKFLEDYKKNEKKILFAIEASEKQAVNDVATIMDTCQQMVSKLELLNDDVNNILSNYDNFNVDTREQEEQLCEMKKNTDLLTNEHNLLRWIDKLNVLSTDINKSLKKKNIQEAINKHNSIYNIIKHLEKTSFGHLKAVVFDAVEKSYEELKLILIKDMESLFKSLKYPFPSGISSPVFNKKENTEAQFKTLILTAVKLKSLEDQTEVSLLATLLTLPMKKRFQFHFYGSKHTNNQAKPEWFFTQISNWIRDHSEFYSGYIQSILDENGHSDIKIKAECSELLLQLCNDKLKCLTKEITTDDSLFAHLIDETLIFHKELEEIQSTHSTTTLEILFEKEILESWLTLEKKFASDAMSMLLDDNENTWLSKYDGLHNTDNHATILYFVPKCVEEYMTFLSLMLLRHKNLENISIQQEFLKVLLWSIETFIVQIKDIASLEVIRPTSQTYCAISNGVHYIQCVLEEWNDDLYFLNLKEHDKHNSGKSMSTDNDQDKNEEDQKKFDELITIVKRFSIGLVESIVEYTELSLQPKLKVYRNEKWHALPPLRDYIMPGLSPAGCDMMLFIKEQLYLLEQKLCPEVFEEIWKQSARVIDKLIFAEVVFETHFNEGGASQFQYDIKNNLFVLFGQYTSKPEFYFKLLKESCTLLNLLAGSAVLLKEVFEQAEKRYKKTLPKENHVKAALQDIGVKHLSYAQVHRILISRIDWPKTS